MRASRGEGKAESVLQHFEVVIEHLRDEAVDRLQTVGVEKVAVAGDERDGTACLQVELRDNTWKSQEAAIDALVELRHDWLDRVAVDFSFGPVADDARPVAISLPTRAWSSR